MGKIRQKVKKARQDFISRNFDSRAIEKYNVTMEGDEENENKQPHTTNVIELKQDKLALLILQDETLSKVILNGIKSSLNWLDNGCHVRIAQVCSKMISLIARHKIKCFYGECAQIFNCCISTLSKNVPGTLANAELNILCAAICEQMGCLCGDLLIGVLKNIPNVQMDDAKKLCGMITAKEGKYTIAVYRQCVKAFNAKYVIGKQNILSSS